MQREAKGAKWGKKRQKEQIEEKKETGSKELQREANREKCVLQENKGMQRNIK